MTCMGDQPWQDESFDAGGYVARARRIADLSQRELAEEAGVGQSTIARWEAGEPSISVAMLDRVLRIAGLRLEVVDESGRAVVPVDPGAVRDNAGRRFPAHLDVVPPEHMPSNRGAGRRYDRPEPQGWYALRPTRDRLVAAGEDRPIEHPTVSDLAARRSARLASLASRRGRPTVLDRLPACACADDCTDHPACPPSCRCQCEPPVPGRGSANQSGWPLE
jgi:HTH-type transcriptional regulator/antitoxin HipB